MKATLFIKDYKIDNVDAEIYYSDVMDGTADTMSVSFIHENDLTKEFNLKTKAEILIEDNVHSIFESGWIMENALYVEGEEVGYLIEGNFVYDIRDPKTLVGAIDYINKTARINEKLYIFDEIGDSSQDLKKPLYLDNRKRYYMCLSQITSNLNSLSANNGYYIYMTLKEQSVLLKDCMRSDCAITPSLYPQFPTQELEVNNLFTFEEKEYYDEYEEMSGGIKITQFKHSILIDGENMFPLHVLLVPVNIPAGTYSYNNIRTDKDFSFVKIDNETYIRTYSVPSYEYSVGSTGTITFEQDIEYIEVQFSTYAVFDNDVISWEIYDPTTIKVSETKFEQIYPTLYEATCKVCDRHNMQLLNDKINVIDDDLAESLKKVSCPNLTYKDLSTFDQLYDIFVRIGRMPYFENNTLYGIKLTGDYNDRTDEFENKFLKSSFERAKLEGINQNVYSTKVYNNVYDEELVTVPTIFTSTARQKYTTVSTKYKNTSDTDDTILAWYNDQLYDWTRLDSRTDQDSKRLLGISNFNDLADGIEDARAYGITLPSNIQYVHSIYKVVPYCRYNSIDRTYEFGFKKSPIGVTINNKNFEEPIKVDDECRFTINGTIYEYSTFCDINGNGRIANISSGFPYTTIDINNYEFYIGSEKYTITNNSRLIEYSYWKELSSLQQKTIGYYTVGENKISQIVSLIVDDINYIRGSFSWSDRFLYEALKSYFYMVEYKPMNSQSYINYDFNINEDGINELPRDVNNYNVPYKTVSDSQIYPLLEYSLEKGLDNNSNLKFVTRDYSILDYNAGDIISINGEIYVINELNFYINNQSVECSMTLTSNITTQSILSSLSDSVRVSSNLSTEDTVTVNMPILSEQIISLDDEPVLEELLQESVSMDNTYFTQNIGKFLSMNTYYNLGLIDNLDNDEKFSNIYNYMTKYPLRFSKLVDENEGESYAYRIRLNSRFPYGTDSGLLEFKFNEFPIYVRKHTFDSDHEIYDSVKINNYYELLAYASSTITLYVRYVDIITKIAEEYCWYDFSLDNVDWVQMRPEMVRGENEGESPYNILSTFYFANEGWKEIKYNLFSDEDLKPAKNPYELLASYNGSVPKYDTMSVYSTEGVLTQSGNITSYIYLLDNPTFLNTRYSATSIPPTITNQMNNNPDTTINIALTIPQTDPIYYNKSNTGCLIEGFGSSYANISNISILDKFSSFGYGYCMDLREILSPSIQFKTIFRDSEKINIKEISKNVNWMNPNLPGSNEFVSQNNIYLLLKVKKSIRLSDLYLDKYNLSDYDSGILVSNPLNTSLNLSRPIFKDEEYDYVLVQTNSREAYELDYIRPIIRFNINDNHSVDKLCLHLDVRNSYTSTPHYKLSKRLSEYIDENHSFTNSYTFNLGEYNETGEFTELLTKIKMVDNITTRFEETLILKNNKEYSKYSFEYLGNIKITYYIENNNAYLKIDFSDLTTDESYPNLPNSFQIWVDGIYKEVKYI